MRNRLFFFIVIFLFIILTSCNAKNLNLSQNEQNWISSHKIIKMGIDNGYGPYSFIDSKGQPQGVVMDYLSKIEKLLGIHFQIISNLTWAELIQAIKEHKIDAIATVKRLPKREKFLNFTQMYLSTPLVVTTRSKTPTIKSIKDLKSMRFSLVKGYASTKKIMLRFPNLKPQFVATPQEALRDIANGKSDAYIGFLGIDNFMAQLMGIKNLKNNVIMDTKKYGQSFGVRKDWPELATILDKTLDAIPNEEKEIILQKWMPLQVGQIKRLGNQDFISEIYPYIIDVLIVLFLSYLFVLWWNQRLKKELAKRREELERAQRIAHFGDWTLDFCIGILTCSNEIFRINGRKPTKFNQIDWPTVLTWLHPETIKIYKENLAIYKNSKPGDIFPPFVSHQIKPNGESIWLEITCRVEYDKNDNPITLYGTALDITQKVKDQKALKEKEDIMLAQSRQAAMGEMISMIAHQWRQPISVIAMEANNIMADIELDTLEIDELTHTARDIMEQTQELSKTIDDFRNFFRPENKPESTTIDKIVKSCMKMLGKSFKSNDIEMDEQIDFNKEITTYPRELMQVLINILKNAKEALMEHSKGERKISLHVKDVNASVVIEIQDNAGGVPTDLLDKIFYPYFSTKDEKNGTGLGLYMSKTIVDKHLKGSLEVKNTHNGACFTIKLPYAIQPKENTNE